MSRPNTGPARPASDRSTPTKQNAPANGRGIPMCEGLNERELTLQEVIAGTCQFGGDAQAQLGVDPAPNSLDGCTLKLAWVVSGAAITAPDGSSVVVPVKIPRDQDGP